MSVNVTTLLDVDVRTQMVLDKMAYEEVSSAAMSDYSSTCRQCCSHQLLHWIINLLGTYGACIQKARWQWVDVCAVHGRNGILAISIKA